MRRILLTIMLCFVLVVPQALAASSISSISSNSSNSSNHTKAITDVSLLLNGKPLQLDAESILQDGVTYVPMRSLLTALGANVQWDEATNSVTATHNETTVKVKVNETKGWTNGKEVLIAHPAQLIDGKVYVSLRWMNESFGAVVKWHAATRTAAVYYPEEGLPRVGSYEHLKSLVSEMSNSYTMNNRLSKESIQMESKALEDAPTAAPAADAASGSGASDYSTTNVQVQGVDESDVVKSDDTYIYQVIEQKVVITRAYPADQMSIVSTIPYADTGFTPMEIYVEDEQLIVIGSSNSNKMDVVPMAEEKRMIYPVEPTVYTTRAIIYDMSDRTAPKQIREVEIEGNYVSSRKIGSSLYLVSNKNINYYYMANEQADVAAPTYRDSNSSDKMVPISYDEIRYFPDSIEPNYLLISGVNLNDNDQSMEVQAYLGSGQNIYASSEHLYVAVTQYDDIPIQPATDGVSSELTKRRYTPQSTQTAIFKFALFEGTITYMADGEVPGTILNQFSMDEHNGNFRIATTSGEAWRSDELISNNNLYVLNESLDTIGKVENIAPGEKIYSVRFMGDRAYMVTFKTVDPLFVIDVADPTNPSILGALKIPGYSDYLHPYDETHIIGFGKDTIEQSNKDEHGNIINTTAYYLGMKIAMFDVTDVTKPKELHTLKIGDRGTNSELLNNHKALLFAKAKNLMAFPVELYEVKANHTSPLEYGQFSYQGAYVYNIDVVKGFTLKGRITHITDEQLSKAGNNWYDSNKNVRRILYMDDTLYTLSNSMIRAHNLSDLQAIGSLNIPK
ncbi:MAG: beta-propeller domain-containing protein [Paenibacillaceae bacterium]